jgi:ribosome-binding protein aMBF1 (putative translation factor)
MDRIMTIEIQRAISNARLAKNMTREELANKAKVNVGVIRDYENGKIVPNNEFIVKLETILGVKLPHAKKKKKVEE